MLSVNNLSCKNCHVVPDKEALQDPHPTEQARVDRGQEMFPWTLTGKIPQVQGSSFHLKIFNENVPELPGLRS